MSQITVSISDELEQKVRSFAQKNDYATLSALITDAIRDKVTAGGGLSYWDRVGLVLQLENNRLLSRLTKNSEDIKDSEWDRFGMYDILRNGYKSEYDSSTGYIDRDELSEGAANFVHDVLDVYADLQQSAKEIDDTELQKTLVFPGFDGNHQGELLGYLYYLARHERWTFVDGVKQPMNSHGMQPDYRSMISRYKEVRNKDSSEFDRQPLTKENTAYIIG